jgi:hypothetical protein
MTHKPLITNTMTHHDAFHIMTVLGVTLRYKTRVRARVRRFYKNEIGASCTYTGHIVKCFICVICVMDPKNILLFQRHSDGGCLRPIW